MLSSREMDCKFNLEWKLIPLPRGSGCSPPVGARERGRERARDRGGGERERGRGGRERRNVCDER